MADTDEDCEVVDPTNLQPEGSQQVHESQNGPYNVIDPAGIRKIGNVTNFQAGGRMKVHMSTDSISRKKIRPKKPLTNSTSALTMDQMLNIKNGLDWRELGRRLKFDDSELEQMRVDHRDDFRELNYQILYCWQQRNPQGATQTNLAMIFNDMFRGDLADLLA